MQPCPFCEIARGDAPARKVFEDDDCLAFHDREPQAPVHVLLIPRRHIATANELGPEAPLAGALVSRAIRLAAELGVADSGYRLVMNTNADGHQTVPHLHLHLLGGRPMRWPPG